MWVAFDNRTKKIEERVSNIEDKVDGADIWAALVNSKVEELEKARNTLQEDVAYIKSQSMRNNLIFTKVVEDNSGGNETPEVTERILRKHLQEDFEGDGGQHSIRART